MKLFLFILLSFISVTAILSGLMMIGYPDGSALNLSPGLLEGTPFKNYMVPGILLVILVGIINLLAVFYNMKRDPKRYTWALAGGIMICVWIITQMILIRSFQWLHIVYLAMGVVVILISFQLKGKAII